MMTLPDPTPLFSRYQALASEAEGAFFQVRESFSGNVSCAEGCADCCHALFDLTLVEAAFLNDAFLKTFPAGRERSDILERAHAADRKIHMIKRRAFKAQQSGEDVDRILEQIGKERVRCPLLGGDDRCVLYAHRPVTCRLYGIPAAVAGRGLVCGKATFAPGERYPTVNMDRIHERLAALSHDFTRHMGSGYAAIHTVLVPVSMALVTTYDAAYYGLDKTAGRNNG